MSFLPNIFFSIIIMFPILSIQVQTAYNRENCCRNDSIEKKYLLGKYNYKTEEDFIRVDLAYGNKEGMYLKKEAYTSFLKMREAALKDGITLVIVSATRSFNEQKAIWEAKWTGKKLVGGQNLSLTISDPTERAKIILKYSSMPGTSRHHWGTDIDINSIEKNYFLTEKGMKVYDWLTKNAHTFGYCQPYNEKGTQRLTGYEEEKWHWSYLPLSAKYLHAFKKSISYSDIKGFSGWETAEELDIIKNYVLGINQSCVK